MIHVNVFGVLYCTHAALPLMHEQGSGHIVNISSVAGRVARAGSGVYNLTKFGVGAFSESLRQEAVEMGVRVTLIEPGAVATELASHNRPEVREQIAKRFGGITIAHPRGHRQRDPLRDRPAAQRERQRGADPSERAGRIAAVWPGSAISSRSPPAWSTCRVVWSSPKRSCSIASISRRAAWQSLSARDEHVRGQRREAARDFPHVEIVDLDHAGLADERLADRCRDRGPPAPPRGRPGPRPSRARARARHQPRDEQRGDRVGALEARREDDRGGERRADEAVEVGEHVLEAALEVQAAAVGP